MSYEDDSIFMLECTIWSHFSVRLDTKGIVEIQE